MPKPKKPGRIKRALGFIRRHEGKIALAGIAAAVATVAFGPKGPSRKVRLPFKPPVENVRIEGPTKAKLKAPAKKPAKPKLLPWQEFLKKNAWAQEHSQTVKRMWQLLESGEKPPKPPERPKRDVDRFNPFAGVSRPGIRLKDYEKMSPAEAEEYMAREEAFNRMGEYFFKEELEQGRIKKPILRKIFDGLWPEFWKRKKK